MGFYSLVAFLLKLKSVILPSQYITCIKKGEKDRQKDIHKSKQRERERERKREIETERLKNKIMRKRENNFY